MWVTWNEMCHCPTFCRSQRRIIHEHMKYVFAPCRPSGIPDEPCLDGRHISMELCYIWCIVDLTAGGYFYRGPTCACGEILESWRTSIEFLYIFGKGRTSPTRILEGSLRRQLTQVIETMGTWTPISHTSEKSKPFIKRNSMQRRSYSTESSVPPSTRGSCLGKCGGGDSHDVPLHMPSTS